MKKQLLDPIGTLCKLVALNFKKVNTKISIKNHMLEIQKPTDYQFLIRWYNHDGKENVSELYYAITRLIEWYLVPNNNNKDESSDDTSSDEDLVSNEKVDNTNSVAISKSQELRKMVRYLCDAFRKLQETYETGNVVLSLQFYINLLEDGLNNKYDTSRLPNFLVNKEQKYENLLDYEKIKNLWDAKKLKRVCELYDSCYNMDKESDSDEITKSAFIDGYLRSIEAILQTTDKEFNNLIINSNRG
jgi:hypothetical protein